MKICAPVFLAIFVISPVVAQDLAPRQQFEVASIRRNLSGNPWYWGPPKSGRWTATNATLKMLTALAWSVQRFAISGGPSWFGTEAYDLSVKQPEQSADDGTFLIMLQNLLKDRFHLAVHQETRETSVLALVPAKGGLRLPNAIAEPCAAFALAAQTGANLSGGMNVTAGLIAADKVSMTWFAAVLESLLGQPVIDRTGFTGSFHVRLEFAPLNSGDSENAKPSIFTALQEQLGLRLESRRAGATVVVIDHAGRPSEN